MSDADHRTVLVTGGTRGIGRAIAQAFARRGDHVALCGRTLEKAQETASEIAAQTGADVHGYAANIAHKEDAVSLIKAVSEDIGPINVLVNNAGVTRDGLLMRMKDEHWNDVLDTNLNGVFYTCRAVSRDMLKARSGRIINLSSIVGLRGQGGQSNYAAAKAGIIGFTKAIAQEFAPRNVTANVVAPGFIDTDMTSGLPEAARKKILDTVPAGRAGSPEDVAATVLFLADDAAAYITGHVLCVDGGLGM